MGQLGANLRNISWDMSQLPVFEKNFYIEHPAVSSRADSAAEDWRRTKSITVIGRGVPKVHFPLHFALITVLIFSN